MFRAWKDYFIFFILFFCFMPLTLTAIHLDIGVTSFEDKIAIFLKHEQGWHTYWKNPGDAGTPNSFTFSLNGKELEFTPFEWPSPTRILKDGLLSYVYKGTDGFFFKWPSLPPKTKRIDLKVKWLACSDRCIPEDAQLQININDGRPLPLFYPHTFDLSQEYVEASFKNLPQKAPWPSETQLTLIKQESGDIFLKTQGDDEILIPFPQEEWTFGPHENNKMALTWQGKYLTPTKELPEKGPFTSPFIFTFLHKGKVISKEFLDYNTPLTSKTEKTEPILSFSFLLILLWAFLGGLLLNVMPCVLPIVSLKLFGLIKHSRKSTKEILRHNLLYTLGILVSLTLLALTLTVFKSLLGQVGWGVQLQSPTFLLLLLFIIFFFALQFLGLFEIQTVGGNYLNSLRFKGGFDDFFNGVLATLLSTPCSAPFFGTALSYALTTSTFKSLLLFWMMGTGLAFPFLITAAFPSLLTLLPKPGHWMEDLKKFLGLLFLFVAIWILYLFKQTAVEDFLPYEALALLSLLFFVIYFKKQKLLFSILTLSLFLHILITLHSPESKEEKWLKWSPEIMTQLKKEHKNVFIDFTADWCLTCKFNEKFIIKSSDFNKWVSDNDIILVKGDWTQKDSAIATFLEQYDVFGVPAYFVQTKEGKIIFIGEIPSLNKLRDTIK